MKRNLLKNSLFFLILFFVLTHPELIDFGNGNLATSAQNKFFGKNNLADGSYNNFKGANNVAQGLLNNIDGNSNIAAGFGNTISGQGNLVAGQGNIVVSGNQMNLDQFQKNIKLPSVQDQIYKRFQSIGINPFANIIPQISPQIPNNVISPASIQTKTISFAPNTGQKIIDSGSNNAPSIPQANFGSQILKHLQVISNNKEIPLPGSVKNLPNSNSNSGKIGSMIPKPISSPQGTLNNGDQPNVKTGINIIEANNFPNNGFQTLQNLQNLQKMVEKPSMIIMNRPEQFSGNRFNNDGYSQAWSNLNDNPFAFNQNSNYWAQQLVKRFSGLTQNRINTNNMMYNVPLLPSYEASLAYQGHSNPFSQYNQIWLDNSNAFNGANSFLNNQPNYFGQNQPFFQQPGYMSNQQYFEGGGYSQVPSQNLMSGQYQMRQRNLRSSKVPEMGFPNQQIYQSSLANGFPNYDMKAPQGLFTRY